MTDELRGHLLQFISSARWFGGKGRRFSLGDVQRLRFPDVAGAGEEGRPEDRRPHVLVELVEVRYDDGDVETYQLPVSYYPGPQEGFDHALIGQWNDEELGEVFAYDALHDHFATPLWLRAFAAGAASGDLVFHRLEGHEIDVDARSALFSGEQSNSSVFFGEDSLMKVFRKVTHGANPDIEIHEALTRAGSEHVAALYGWVETHTPDGEPVHLAMLQQFLRTASDGWVLALASVRDLYAEGDLHAHEVGGDFAGEAHRLGVATAEVHEALAAAFPTEVWGAAELKALADAMDSRLDAAVEVVPQLAEHVDGLRSTYDAVRSVTDDVPVQRVHGDLHLGQTLRTVRGWKLVDFEGEPAKPLAERVRPDSAWRDVAGMLRSFDYAAHAVASDVQAAPEAQAQVAARAAEWAERNRTAFLEGYESVRPQVQPALLRAYEVDKAVYETVYEARNRPGWIRIPLAAIERLAG